MKGDEGRDERQADGSKQIDDGSRKSARVCPLSSNAEHAIVQRFDGARHEQRSRCRASRGSRSRWLQQVLDLDRDVVADRRMRRVQRLDDAHRVRRTVEEIGIAERDVLRARRRPARRCRPARRPAARPGTARRTPARPDNAGRGAGSRGSLRCSRRVRRVPSAECSVGVARERRKAGAVGDEKVQPRDARRSSFGVRRSTAIRCSAHPRRTRTPTSTTDPGRSSRSP